MAEQYDAAKTCGALDLDTELIAPGVTRTYCSWGSIYRGSRDSLVSASIVQTAWLADGTERTKRGQVVRTKEFEVDGRSGKCTFNAKSKLYSVSIDYGDHERDICIEKFTAAIKARSAAAEERSRLKKITEHAPLGSNDFKNFLLCSAEEFLSYMVDLAAGGNERRVVGFVTAELPVDVIEKLMQLKQQWLSTVMNASVLLSRRARLRLVK